MDGGSALSRQVYASVVLGAATPERLAGTQDHVASTAAPGRTTVFFIEHQPYRTTTRTIGQLQQPQALEMQRVERHPSRRGAPARTMTGHSPTSTQVALRTVPVTLRNGQRSINVNALLDDGSTQSYLNSAIAAELGIQAESKSMTVSTLNGQTRTFRTMPVNIQLESCDGTFRSELHATSADRVTGDSQAVDWQVNGPQWRHLQSIPFHP